MRQRRRDRAGVAAAIILALAAMPARPAELPPDLPEILGIVGFDEDAGAAYVAMRVDYPQSYALQGILWYNNDDLVTYPTVRMGTGYWDGPGDVGDMTIVAQAVGGPGSAWGSVAFSEPIGAVLGGVYAVFELPGAAAFEGLGTGGGPGFGYCDGAAGVAGWMSCDGQQWVRLHRRAGLAVRPLLVPLAPGMLVKSLGEAGAAGGGDLPVARPYLDADPNPFNPRVSVALGLPRAARVELAVYDVRGRRVARLVDGMLAAGRHEVSWTGDDDRGRAVASGVYMVRLRLGGEELVCKLALVR